MPVTIAQFNALYAHTTPDEAFGFPERPLPKSKILELLKVSTAVAHCWVAEQAEVHPLFPGAPARVLLFAEQVLERDKKIRTTIADNPRKASPWAGREKDDMSFLGTFNGGLAQQHNTRPFIKLLFDHEASAEAFEYIDDVLKRSLRSAASPESVSWRLFVGWRHWNDEGVSGWIRAKTLLFAHQYEMGIHQAAARLGVIVNSMAHVPNLTSRQSRRTGVAQGELRQKWA